uniref:Uncharacterized protein n=1 Tax=Anguilla anguilla TaxID=7936 RepID=A0A0E9W973_ANGAN
MPVMSCKIIFRSNKINPTLALKYASTAVKTLLTE